MVLKDKTIFWLTSYWLAWIIGIGLWILGKLGRLKIVNRQRLPKRLERVILISNHPSLWEPTALYALFFSYYARHPSKTPYSLPDGNNYYNKWYWWPFRGRFLPVNRGQVSVGMIFRGMIKVLDDNSSMIIFPEGGRTAKLPVGEQYVYSNARFDRKKAVAKIRPFKEGVAKLALKKEPTIIPVWVSGSDRVLPIGSAWPRLWNRTTIKVGEPLYGADYAHYTNASEFNELLMQKVLALADE